MLNLFNKIATSIGWMIIVGVSFTCLIILITIFVFKETSLDSGADPDRKVAVIDITGEILSADSFRQDIYKYSDDDTVKAIVVRIDSPGGTVGASEEMFRLIKSAREKKPVVCSLGSIAASGGLYASMGCDKIVTNRGTISGSIGVIMYMPNVASLASKFGVDMTVIKSGEFKDSGSPFRVVTQSDRAVLQDVVSRSFEQFVSVIAENRKIQTEAVRKFADGRVILGDQAVSLGLADEIGGLETAAKIALKLRNIDKEPDIVLPRKSKGIMALIDSASESHALLMAKMINYPQLWYK